MLLIPRVVALFLLGLVSLGGCADDEVPLPEHPMIGQYSTGQPSEARTDLIRFDIRADNIVIYEALDSCGEYVSEATYAWEAVREDKITITAMDGGWIDDTYKIDVTPGDDCSRLIFSYYTSEYPLYDFMVTRGRLCLSMSDAQCMADWCEESLSSCD